METLTLDTPTEARARVALAIYKAAPLNIAALTRGVIDPSNTWTADLPHHSANLRQSALTETDHETERALHATANHLDLVDAARWAHRMEGLNS